jgi:hypothetical protein
MTYCDSILKTLSSDHEQQAINEYQELRWGITHDSELTVNVIRRVVGNSVYLLTMFDIRIVDQSTGEDARSLVIEYFKTEFSAGKNLYVIKSKGDSVRLSSILDYIN